MFRTALLLAFCAALLACTPNKLSALTPKERTDYSGYLVTSAEPAASEAGAAMIERGGSAVDAAVAMQAVLGLVEPQSSGVGGGAFLVYYDAKSGKISTYDGREMAPAAMKPDQFLDANGKPKPYLEKVVGGQSVGVPGVMEMLALAHKDHGKLPWAALFDDGIKLADDGFALSQQTHDELSFLSPIEADAGPARLFLRRRGQSAAGRNRNPQHRLRAHAARARRESARASMKGRSPRTSQRP